MDIYLRKALYSIDKAIGSLERKKTRPESKKLETKAKEQKLSQRRKMRLNKGLAGAAGGGGIGAIVGPPIVGPIAGAGIGSVAEDVLGNMTEKKSRKMEKDNASQLKSLIKSLDGVINNLQKGGMNSGPKLKANSKASMKRRATKNKGGR